MAQIKLKGNPIHTVGNLPSVDSSLPDFNLTTTDLGDVTLNDFKGQRLVLNIFPSLDTAVCAASVRQFNKLAAGLKNTKVLCISMDLPFAHKRFCTSEGIEHVINLSELHERGFGETYGVRIIDGPMRGLFARSVIIADETGKIIYAELVPEITQEPDYEAAMKVLK